MELGDQTFIELKSAQLDQWRALPITKLFAAMLEDQAKLRKEQLPQLVEEDKFAIARILTGELRAYEYMRMAMEGVTDIPEEPEVPVVDEAIIRRKK